MNQQVGGDHLWAGSPDPVAFFPFSTPSAYLLLWTYRFSGDVETGKTILRDYIKATVGFEKLGAATGSPPKSLIRMFGPRGNPQAKNLFSVIGYLQNQAGVRLHVTRG
jgi:hypothetical protein